MEGASKKLVYDMAFRERANPDLAYAAHKDRCNRYANICIKHPLENNAIVGSLFRGAAMVFTWVLAAAVIFKSIRLIVDAIML